jgi:hypothetical protein
MRKVYIGLSNLTFYIIIFYMFFINGLLINKPFFYKTLNNFKLFILNSIISTTYFFHKKNKIHKFT